jgi:hypothetical protein
VSCGEVHSQAREMVEQGYERKLVATVLAISRSSLCYRKRPRGSRADRTLRQHLGPFPFQVGPGVGHSRP